MRASDFETVGQAAKREQYNAVPAPRQAPVDSQDWAFIVPVASREEIAAGYVVPVDPMDDLGCDSCQ